MSFSAFVARQHQELHDRIAVQVRNPVGAANRVSFDQESQGEDDLLFRDVRTFQGGLVGFGVGLAALRATEPAEAIPMLAKALAAHVTYRASHCQFGIYFACHGSIIQLTLAVCQEKKIDDLGLDL